MTNEKRNRRYLLDGQPASANEVIKAFKNVYTFMSTSIVVDKLQPQSSADPQEAYKTSLHNHITDEYLEIVTIYADHDGQSNKEQSCVK